MGGGQGFAAGAASISDSVLRGIQLGNQQRRYDQLDERYDRALDQDEARHQEEIDYNLEWQRGLEGLAPSWTEEASAKKAADTRPTVPSSQPSSAPGPLGIPQTTFPVGQAVQPMPPEAPRPSVGARALLPDSLSRPPRLSSSRRSSVGALSRMGGGRRAY